MWKGVTPSTYIPLGESLTQLNQPDGFVQQIFSALNTYAPYGDDIEDFDGPLPLSLCKDIFGDAKWKMREANYRAVELQETMEATFVSWWHAAFPGTRWVNDSSGSRQMNAVGDLVKIDLRQRRQQGEEGTRGGEEEGALDGKDGEEERRRLRQLKSEFFN